MINSTSEIVELSTPEIEIEDFSIPLNGSSKVDNTKKSHATRLALLLENLNLKELNEDEKESLIKIFNEFPNQFYLPGDKLGPTNVLKHKIIKTDKKPIFVKQYRYPPMHKNKITKQINELSETGIIKPSVSPFNSPLRIVPKKSDSKGNKRWRMVIDYRKLNEITVGDAYPIPSIIDIIDQCGGAKYFSVLDLALGFHQIELDPDSKHKTAFSAPFGHYEYNRMPFGLKTAPSTFQRLMDIILTGLQGIDMFIYMDAIVIYASSLEEHSQKLRRLLGRLKTAGLMLQPDKCFFLQKEIVYLGHLITDTGVKPDPKKVEAVRKFPIPKTKNNIKEFLGLTGYYRRFISDYSKIAKPCYLVIKR